jgi:hypothetical protein
LITKIIEFFGNERMDQSSTGALMVVIGGILAAMVVIMRSQWKVTDKSHNPSPTSFKTERDELDQI